MPGSTIRLRITSDEALRQQSVLGELTTTLQGRAVQGSGQGDIGLTVRRTDGGPAGPSFNAFIAVPLRAVEHVEERRLDVIRTALLAGGAAATAIAVISISAGGTETSEPPDSNARLRLLLVGLKF